MGGFFPDSLHERVRRLEQGLGPWVFPELLNGCQQARDVYSDTRFKLVCYRLGVGPHGFDFDGHIVLPTTPVEAFIVIEDMRLEHFIDLPITIAAGPNPTDAFAIGRIFVDPDTGIATINLPS